MGGFARRNLSPWEERESVPPGKATWFGSLRRMGAELFLWLLPLLVVAEYVGTTFGNPLRATAGMLALFAGVLFLTPGDAPRSALPRLLSWLGRLVGLAAVSFGVFAVGKSLAPLFAPARFPLPALGIQSEREWFLFSGVLAVYPIAFGWRLLRGRSSGRDIERLGLLIALVLLAHQVGQLRVQFLPVLPYGRPGLDAVTTTAAGVLALLCFVPKVPAFVRFAALLGVGLGLRYVGLETWALEPSTRDMLPLMKNAQDAFFSGHDPYGLHQMQVGSVVPLTYLPGMWLLWSVPRWFGATDFRLMGLIADAAVATSLFWAASGAKGAHRAYAQGAASAFAAVWLLSPSVAWNGIYAEPHAWWFVLSLTLAATVRRKWWLAATALGVALATRHFAAVLAPFVLLAMAKHVGLRAALPKVAWTGVVAAALLVPFVAMNPDAFWFGTFHWLVEYGPVHQNWFWERYGFAGTLYRENATQWIPRAQVAIPSVCFLIAIVLRGRRSFIAPAGTAYVLFVMFNGIIWDSFFLGCALFAAFAAAGAHDLPQPMAPGKRPRFARIATALGLAAALGSGAYLLKTLADSRSSAGLGKVREALASNVRPDDGVVDRAEWNVAFVRAKGVFAGALPPAPTARHPLDPALGPFGAFGHPRAWFVLRHGREGRLLRQLRTLGGVFEDRRLGHYRLLGLEGVRVDFPLSSRAGSAPVRPCRLAGNVRAMAQASPERKRPATSSFRTTLSPRLLVFAGFDDSSMVWGRRAAVLEVRVDGSSLGHFRIGNLPGPELGVFDTSRYVGGEHDVELTLTTRDPRPRTVCLEGWALTVGK